jgi:hypothetical protein
MLNFSEYVYTFFELEYYSIIIVQTKRGEFINLIIEEYE